MPSIWVQGCALLVVFGRKRSEKHSAPLITKRETKMISGPLNRSTKYNCQHVSSLLGLLGLLLFLILLLTLTGLLFLVVSEFFNQEGSHDSIADLTGCENTTVTSRDRSLGGSQPPEVVWSGNLNTLHFSSLGVFLNKMHHKFSTWSLNWLEVVAPGSV